jgi:capsular polysaccharide biosynthesis protein
MQSDPRIQVEQSLQAIWRALPMICVVGVVAFGIGYIGARKTPPSYQVHFSYIIAQTQRDASSDFRYDGFYSLSGTELFSATLASLITSPEQIVSAYNLANIAVSSQDPFALAKHVQAIKSASQLVQVTVTDNSKITAESLADAVEKKTEQAVQEYNVKNKDTAQFSITPTTPFTGVVIVAALPVGLVFGAFAVMLSVLLVLFKEALKRGKE